MVYAKLSGKYIGVEPGTTTVYADRPAGGSWEELDIVKRNDGKYIVTFRSAQLVLSIQPDGRLETRPFGTDGPWEQLTIKDGILSREGINVSLQLEGFVEDTKPSGTPLERVYGASQYYFNKFIKGESGFLDYELFLQGRLDQLHSVLRQSLKLGSNCRRNFLMTMNTAVAGGLPPFNPDDYGDDFFNKLPSFLDIYQEYGIYMYGSVFPDNGLLPGWTDLGKQQRHWNRLGEVAKSHNGVFALELTNEIDAHGFNWVDNTKFSPIGGVLCCSGSMGDTGGSPMPDPQWDFCDHHTNRNRYPNRVVDECKANHPSRLKGKRMVSGEPIGIGNPAENPNRTDNVQEAKERACGRTTCAGMFVHSTHGGLSQLYDDFERPCVEAWFRELQGT